MAKKTLSAVRAVIRQKLRDEFGEGKEFEWENDELNILIGDCLAEVSECSPYQVKETLTTSVGSRELDISSITDWLYIDEGEYPVGKFPKRMRNCTIFGNTLTIETDLSPAADEDVYLYCAKTHQLTDSASTLNPQEERILILGVVGQAAINRARSLINKVNIGGARTPADMQGWGIAQLALYRGGLSEITEARVWVEHPRG